MITELSLEILKFIRDHENEDEKALVLRQRSILGVPSRVIAEQIAARKKAKTKLPTWYETQGIIFPPALNFEQTSSEITARYKYEILKNILGSSVNSAVDLTGGFGTDTYFLSRLFSKVDYLDSDEKLVEIARHNHRTLNAGNISHHQDVAENFLKAMNASADLIFIDPSRRKINRKAITLSDSEPNILDLQSQIFLKAKHLLIKASPLLDITLGIRQLLFVRDVFVVAVNNEVKELLFFSEKGFSAEPLIHAVNLLGDAREELGFLSSEEASIDAVFGDPQAWLYEPNAAILKAGAFKLLTHKFHVFKIHPSTHLYTSESLIDNFPGRTFKLRSPLKLDAKVLAKVFPNGKANIITRNYPLSVDELKKKSKLKDGGHLYLLAFSGVAKRHLYQAVRIK